MRRELSRPPWRLLVVLLGAVGVGPLLLYGLSSTSDRIINALSIDEAQFGMLATACFACATIGNATLGRVADRHSDLSLMTTIFVVASLALVLASLHGGYGLLLVAAGLAGFAQSFPNGVTNRILLERVPSERRIGWIGIKQSGVQVSQLVASVIFPLLAVWVGWRGATLVTALVPLLLLALCWHALRTVPLLPVPDAGMSVVAQASAEPEERDVIARGPGALWPLVAFGLLSGIGLQATNVYLPLFAVRELDFSLVVGGLTAAVVGAVGVGARVGWARVMARGTSGLALLLVLALIAFVGACAFLGAWAAGSTALLWTAVVLHGSSALGVAVVLMGAVLRSTPSFSMASASGVVTAGTFAGFTLGPVGMGIVVRSPGGFGLGWVFVAIIYLACITLASILLVQAKRTAGK